MTPRTRNGYLLCLAAAALWAGTAPLIGYLLDRGVPRLPLALWRDVFVALACLGVVGALRPRALRLGRIELRGVVITGVVAVGIYHAIWVWSVALNGAAVAVVLIYLYPAFVTLAGWLFDGERLGAAQVAALMLALLGLALVVRVYDPAVLRLNWLGAVVGILSALTHTIYVLFNQRAVTTINPIASLGFTMLFGSLTLLALNLIVAPTEIFAVGSAENWALLALLGLVPTLGGYALFTMALRYIPGKTASLLSVVEAPITALIAWAWLGDRLEGLQLVGMALVLFAITLPRLAELRRPATAVVDIS